MKPGTRIRLVPLGEHFDEAQLHGTVLDPDE